MSSDTARGLFDEIDVNRDGKIDENELSQWVGSGPSGDVTSSSSITNYVSRYPTDGRGFYLDPNPEIITRPNPGPPTTYTQKITIRYLQPPPLPPAAENVIREVRPPPLQAPSPFLIRESSKPGYRLPPLILRERPPEPPRTTVIERFANPPNHPRDIILERWLPYETRPPPRTVRIPATSGPPRNKIMQYQSLKARAVREFQRVGVTRADPEAYIREHYGSLLDSTTLLQKARATGVVGDTETSSENHLPDNKTKLLRGLLSFVPNMPVLLTDNIAYELGLWNGTQGTFGELVYDFEKEPGGLKEKSESFRSNTICVRKPLYALVEINTSQVETSLNGHRPKLISIPQTKKQFNVPFKQLFGRLFERGQDAKKVPEVIQVTRTQLPVVPAFAITTYTTQGSKVKRAEDVALLRPLDMKALKIRPSLTQDAEL